MTMRLRVPRPAAGSGLVALLIALSLSLVIVLASLQVMAMSHGEYLQAEQALLMDEQAAYVVELLEGLLQRAGHVDPARASHGMAARPFDGALAGHDNAGWVLQPGGAGRSGPNAWFGSDALAIRVPVGDGQGASCGGLASGDGLSLFDIATGVDGEPELRCRYRSGAYWSTQPIATGIAAMQLLYGLDSDQDGLPNGFLNATRIDALDAGRDRGQPSAWTRVVAVRLALLLRSPQRLPALPSEGIDLFGARHADRHADEDAGVRIAAEALDRHRLWRRYDAVIFLHNSLAPAP